jgi:hypothetical protein
LTDTESTVEFGATSWVVGKLINGVRTREQLYRGEVPGSAVPARCGLYTEWPRKKRVRVWTYRRPLIMAKRCNDGYSIV